MRIELSQGLKAEIDDEDFESVSRFRWHAIKGHSTFYAVRNGVGPNGPRSEYLHRFLLQPEGKLQVDHINGNGLDNRRCNLRLATHAQNLANAKPHRSHGKTSYFKGVYWNSLTKKWIVRVGEEYVGCYDDEERAAWGYDIAALAKYGAYAQTNYPWPEIQDRKAEPLHD